MSETPTEYRVWWIPQIPGEPFTAHVDTVAVGRWLCRTLARYDAFQLEHRIKPDYANTGGVQYKSTETDGEWWDVDEEDES